MLNRRRLLAGAGVLTAGALTPGLAACGSSASTTAPWKSDPYFQNGDPIFPVSYAQTTAPIPAQTTTGLHFPARSSAGRNAVLQAYVMTDMMGDTTQKGTSVSAAVQTAHNRMVQIFEQQGQKQ